MYFVVFKKTVLLFLDDAHGLRGDIGGLLESEGLTFFGLMRASRTLFAFVVRFYAS
jgi:hypothetical protein